MKNQTHDEKSYFIIIVISFLVSSKEVRKHAGHIQYLFDLWQNDRVICI